MDILIAGPPAPISSRLVPTDQLPELLEGPVLPRQDGPQRLAKHLRNLLEAQSAEVSQVNDPLIGIL